ncbi:MAG: hypothetical protein A2Z72_05755 [Omnitrophica bacterium RBG_13_46_9]|nr:MAG: hypothetical protein A2Z72_05755 [Omnitrophica bacterium RBG_13_46_9]
MKKIIIIGTGPAGLGAAYRLKELKHSKFIVYERNSYAGGLCASFKDDKGFTWDLGGHILFTYYAYFDRLLKKVLRNNYLEHQREAWIRTMKRWIPYPFQDNIMYLPRDILLECLKGLDKARRQKKESTDFEEWIINNMGEGIAKYFMVPYNLKVWAYPLSLLGTNWISERVSKISLEEVVSRLVSNVSKTNWGPNVKFKYPLYGGIGEIFRRIACLLRHKIKYDTEVTKVDPRRRKVFLSGGKEDTYDVLINTSPLDSFLMRLEGCDKKLLHLCLDLRHNGVFVVGIGIHRPCPSNKGWMYFPGRNCPFFRTTYLSNYSPNNVPDKKKYYSLLCESAYSEYKKEDKSEIFEKTIRGLINTGLIDKDDRKFIVSKFVRDINCAYPIPTLGRDRALRKIQPELEKMDIYSRGRFGAWKYEIANTDHSVMQGKEIVDRILKKGRENVWSL